MNALEQSERQNLLFLPVGIANAYIRTVPGTTKYKRLKQVQYTRNTTAMRSLWYHNNCCPNYLFLSQCTTLVPEPS